MNGERCVHGSLKRQCYLCELIEEIEQLKLMEDEVYRQRPTHAAWLNLQAENAHLKAEIVDLRSEAGIHSAFAPNGCPVCYDRGWEEAKADDAIAINDYREALRQREWFSDEHGIGWCDDCGAKYTQPHIGDCPMVTLLGGAE
jgi:hypothetical protein